MTTGEEKIFTTSLRYGDLAETVQALEVDAKQLTSGCKTDAKPSKRQ